jgi:hypothetical protein
VGDTSPEVEALYREALLKRSNEERFIMGAMMFEAARAMVVASLDQPQNSPAARTEYFRRVYRDDLPEDVLDHICAWIRAATPGNAKVL